MKTLVLAVDQSLVFAESSLPKEYSDALSLSLLWSQAVARNANPDPASNVYGETLTQELATIGWNIITSSSTTYRQDAGHFCVADVLEQLLTPDLDDQQAKQLAALLTALQQPVHTDFLAFWLHQSQNASVTSLAIGALFASERQPATKIMRYSFTTSDSNWQSLFVASNRTTLTVSIDFVEMTLNMSFWQQIQEPLKTKLAGSIQKNIQSLELNL